MGTTVSKAKQGDDAAGSAENSVKKKNGVGLAILTRSGRISSSLGKVETRQDVRASH